MAIKAINKWEGNKTPALTWCVAVTHCELGRPGPCYACQGGALYCLIPHIDYTKAVGL